MAYTEQRSEGKSPQELLVRARMYCVRLWLRFFGPRWNVGALSILRDSQGRVCLLKHKGRLKPWGLPGGFAVWPETPVQALRRELQEELGWEDAAQRSFVLRHDLQSDTVPLLELVFELQGAVSVLETEHWSLQESEIEEVSWMSFEQVMGLEGILERHRELLTNVLRHS